MCAAPLAGCSSFEDADPVAWWHDLQGGEIAKQRPPPPGSDDPYPNLATVPAKPAAPDPKLRQQVADALVADRGAAQREAAAAPIPPPTAAPAKPATPAAPAATDAPADPNAVTASLNAASAPPPPKPAPPHAAPAGAGPASAGPGGAQPASVAPADVAASFANLPPLPDGPPPQASLPGLDPASAAGAATRRASEPVPVGFLAGSTAMTPAGADLLRVLAATRGAALVSLTGYGEAASKSPDVQAAALSLGLARAQAMAAALTSSGVPAAAVRLEAEASGRGGAARLLN
jgi:outer membrane protein OmpA-like peptidoglycan-associated protein